MSKRRRASDQTVFGHDMYLLMQTLHGQQWCQALRQLQQTEPDLAAYVTSASQTVEMNLTAHDCPSEGVRTTEQFVLHALVIVAIAVREGQRRLMEEWLPDDGMSGGGVETKS